MVARLKLKGIDGMAPQDVEYAAQFDPTRENLPGPDAVRIDRLRALSRSGEWWCMAALGWWGDLSG